jgi:hypothetical protein
VTVAVTGQNTGSETPPPKKNLHDVIKYWISGYTTGFYTPVSVAEAVIANLKIYDDT